MRRLRETLSFVLPMLGMGVAFAGVLFVDGNTATLLTVLAGILLVEAGVWNLANPFLPSSRRYSELRLEVDGFIDLVRHLNAAAVRARESGAEGEWEAYREALGKLHESVDRIGALAGKAQDEEPTRAPSEGQSIPRVEGGGAASFQRKRDPGPQRDG